MLILILGVFLRFVNIDKKAYWDDEAFTSLRVSGYREYELVEKVAAVDRLSVGELAHYQNLNPQKNLIHYITSLPGFGYICLVVLSLHLEQYLL
jgi:uncharacterized membrane protein